jgi:uncharacterized protein
MLTVPQAARLAKRNPETIRRWIREGKLPFTRVGTQYLIDVDDLPGVGQSHLVQEAAAPYRVARAQPAGTGVDPWLTTIVGRLVHEFDPARIVLFGARARGEAQSDSDYDLLVVLDVVADRRAMRLAVRRTLDDLPISKEVLVASVEDLAERGPSTWGPISWAQSEGQTLYERA